MHVRPPGCGNVYRVMTREHEMWAELHSRMRGFIGRRVADPHTADDLAQDVLVRLHGSLATLRTGDRLDALAYRIARNAIIDHYRATGRAKETPTEPAEFHAAVAPAADPTPPARALARCMRPLVDRLPEASRQALLLTDLGDSSQVDAARALGLSVPGMKSRVQRARAEVRDLLAACCSVQLDRRNAVTEVQRTGPCACGGPGLRAER